MRSLNRWVKKVVTHYFALNTFINVCIDPFSPIKLKDTSLYNIIKAYIERYARTADQDQKALEASASPKTNQNPNPKTDLGASTNYVRTDNSGKHGKRPFSDPSGGNPKKQKTDGQD